MSYDNLFWERKLNEQDEEKSKEIHHLMDSLGQAKDGYKKILSLKKHFQQGGQYHHVLKTWKIDLDAIFNLAERHLR